MGLGHPILPGGERADRAGAATVPARIPSEPSHARGRRSPGDDVRRPGALIRTGRTGALTVGIRRVPRSLGSRRPVALRRAVPH